MEFDKIFANWEPKVGNLGLEILVLLSHGFFARNSQEILFSPDN